MYWTYENTVHQYARVHLAECAHCNDGRGIHDAVESRVGRWLGPYGEIEQAIGASIYQAQRCGHCFPGPAVMEAEPVRAEDGSFGTENIDAAIAFAIENCSSTSITYTELFSAAALQSPQWYFEHGLRSVITQIMEAFHHACAHQGLPPFDAFVVNALGSERAGYPGTGYFTINGLRDPLSEHSSNVNVREAFSFREAELSQIRSWCRGQR